MTQIKLSRNVSDVDTSGVADGEVLTYNASLQIWEPRVAASGGSATFDDQPPHYVFAGPTSSPNAQPAFRALVVTDVPDLSGTYLTTSAHTSIGNSSPHHAPITLDDNADTILSLSTQALGLDTQTANRVFAGPASGAGAIPTFRTLVSADIPDLSGSYLTPAAHTSIGNSSPHHAPVTLATDSGLSLSTQQLAMGTPSSITTTSTNAVSGASHTHAITGFQTALTNPVTGTGAANRVTFWTSSSAVSYDNAFVWDNTNKRLGINTTAPAYPADFEATGDGSSVSTVLFVAQNNTGSMNNSGDGVAINFGIGSNGNTPVARARIEVKETYYSARPTMDFQTTDYNSPYTAFVSRIFIASAGYVGINTQSPLVMLHVNSSATSGVISKQLMPSLASTSAIETQLGRSAATGECLVTGFVYNSTTTSSYAYLGVYGDNTGAGVGLTIKKGGNVGIGTTSPYSKLHLVHSTNIDPSLTYHSANAWSFETASAELAGGVLTTSPWSYWLQVRASNNTALPLVINPLGGYVGIGTVSPVGALTIDTNAETKTYQMELIGNTSTGYTWLGNYATTTYISTNAKFSGSWSQDDATKSSWSVTLGPASDTFRVARIPAGSTTWSYLMEIGSTGNVGLGVTSPKSPLHIACGASVQATIGGNGAHYGANLYYSGGWKYASNSQAGVLIGLLPTGVTAGDFAIYTAPNSGASGVGTAATLTARFTVLEGGYVGIGTTAPDKTLVIYTAGQGATKLLVESDQSTNWNNSTGGNLGRIDFATDGAGSGKAVIAAIRAYAVNSVYGVAFDTYSSTDVLTVLGTNVGIGTRTPSSLLSISGASTTTTIGTTVSVRLTNTNTTTGNITEVSNYSSGGTLSSNIVFINENHTTAAGSILFNTRSSDGTAIFSTLKLTMRGNLVTYGGSDTSPDLTDGGSIAIGGDLSHQGTYAGFYGKTPVTRPTAIASVAGSFSYSTGSYGFSSATMVGDLITWLNDHASKINLVLAALRSVGLIAT